MDIEAQNQRTYFAQERVDTQHYPFLAKPQNLSQGVSALVFFAYQQIISFNTSELNDPEAYNYYKNSLLSLICQSTLEIVLKNIINEPIMMLSNLNAIQLFHLGRLVEYVCEEEPPSSTRDPNDLLKNQIKTRIEITLYANALITIDKMLSSKISPSYKL